MKKALVVCSKLKPKAHYTEGSVVSCANCGCQVWLSNSTKRQVFITMPEGYKEHYEVNCFECDKPELPKGNIQPPSAEQINEITSAMLKDKFRHDV